VTVSHVYDWNGQAFEFNTARYELNPVPELLSFCSLVVEHSANVWGVETTIQLMETILPTWPPESTVNGDPFPEDALDEWRYRLALYHAMLGNEAQALGYANAITSNPATPDSSWILPAQEFLAAFQTPRDIYRVCLPSRFCDPRFAFQGLVSTLPADDYPRAPEILKEAGVTIRASGFFDFDNDGETERWIVLRHQPGAELEFWILAPIDTGLKALFVDFVESDQLGISYLEPLDEPPVVLIGQELTFRFEKQGANREPSVFHITPQPIFSADRTKLALDQVEAALLSGGDPAQARDELVKIEQSPFFTCSYLLCPRYLYLLGLSHELAGDEQQAVEAYLELWRQYLGHPLVNMARLKLSGPAIPPGPTLTPTRTGTQPTPTRTRTPTSTGGGQSTSTPTPTLSAAGGSQPTSTPTLTLEPYP
jgi:hypothetical protein